MTRKEAKAILEEVKAMDDSIFQYVKPYMEALEVAIKELGQEPREDATLKDIFCMGCEYKEQETKTDWIHVSERLPGYGEKVLCWTTYNAFEVGYRDNEWGQDVWTTGKFASGTFSVVAWMPLPEPYRQEAENG